MANIYYDKRISANSNERKCAFCGKQIKMNDIIEIIGITNGNTLVTGHPGQRVFFCEGHLSTWLNKQQREFLLSKL